MSREPKRVRFSHSFIRYLETYVLSGLTGNSEIARILSEAFDADITAADVAQWRRQHPRFERMCLNAVDNMNAVAVGVITQAIRDGSTAEARWWLERRHPDFKPASKVDFSGRVEGLADMLNRRSKVTEDDLRATGVLIYDDDADE